MLPKLCTCRIITTIWCVRGVIVILGLLVRLSHSATNTLSDVYTHDFADSSGFGVTAGSHGRGSCGNNSRTDA